MGRFFGWSLDDLMGDSWIGWISGSSDDDLIGESEMRKRALVFASSGIAWRSGSSVPWRALHAL